MNCIGYLNINNLLKIFNFQTKCIKRTVEPLTRVIEEPVLRNLVDIKISIIEIEEMYPSNITST